MHHLPIYLVRPWSRWRERNMLFITLSFSAWLCACCVASWLVFKYSSFLWRKRLNFRFMRSKFDVGYHSTVESPTENQQVAFWGISLEAVFWELWEVDWLPTTGFVYFEHLWSFVSLKHKSSSLVAVKSTQFSFPPAKVRESQDSWGGCVCQTTKSWKPIAVCLIWLCLYHASVINDSAVKYQNSERKLVCK